MATKKKPIIQAKVETRQFKDIHPNPDNPRINDEAIPKLVESIRKQGYNDFITINKDGLILAGHTRYAALKELGMKPDDELRVHVADHLVDSKGKAYSLVDNKVAEQSGWDFEKLQIQIEELQPIEDLSEWFPPMDDESAVEGVQEDDGGDQDYEEAPEPEPKKKTVICPHCGEVIELD